jgi:hypothetical protein
MGRTVQYHLDGGTGAAFCHPGYPVTKKGACPHWDALDKAREMESVEAIALLPIFSYEDLPPKMDLPVYVAAGAQEQETDPWAPYRSAYTLHLSSHRASQYPFDQVVP